MKLNSSVFACFFGFLLMTVKPNVDKFFSGETEITRPANPVVEWKTEKEHDFGEIKAGSVTRFAFKFKNMDTEPILVETVRTTCGCTAASWTETPVLPGESGEVLIEYDSEKKGSFRKKIKVFFDRQKKAEILFVEGEVI